MWGNFHTFIMTWYVLESLKVCCSCIYIFQDCCAQFNSILFQNGFNCEKWIIALVRSKCAGQPRFSFDWITIWTHWGTVRTGKRACWRYHDQENQWWSMAWCHFKKVPYQSILSEFSVFCLNYLNFILGCFANTVNSILKINNSLIFCLKVI